ncbi:MAG: HEAT repeat domain-containing protein [Dongiaceae bacterium]
MLGRLGDRAAVEPMIARLSDGHGGVRREAAIGLGYLGDAAALPALLAAAEGDGDERVRAAARESARLLGADADPAQAKNARSTTQ